MESRIVESGAVVGQQSEAHQRCDDARLRLVQVNADAELQRWRRMLGAKNRAEQELHQGVALLARGGGVGGCDGMARRAQNAADSAPSLDPLTELLSIACTASASSLLPPAPSLSSFSALVALVSELMNSVLAETTRGCAMTGAVWPCPSNAARASLGERLRKKPASSMCALASSGASCCTSGASSLICASPEMWWD